MRTWGKRTKKHGTYEGARRLGGRAHEGVEEHAEQVEVLVVEVEPPALVFANPAVRTQAAGGALVVGEVTARVGVEGGRWPVRTRGLPSNDTRRGSHVLLDSPEVAASQRTSART